MAVSETQTERCQRCQGYGWVPTSASTLAPDWQPCSWCQGRGNVTYRRLPVVEITDRTVLPSDVAARREK